MKDEKMLERVFVEYFHPINKAIIDYGIMLKCQLGIFCLSFEGGKESSVFRILDKGGLRRQVGLPELALIFYQLHVVLQEMDREFFGKKCTWEKNGAAIIDIPDSLLGLEASLRIEYGALKTTLFDFCQQHAKSGIQTLHVPLHNGEQILVDLPLLAKIFYVLHFRNNLTNHCIMVENSTIRVKKEAASRFFIQLLEVAKELKISHLTIPQDVMNWLGENNSA